LRLFDGIFRLLFSHSVTSVACKETHFLKVLHFLALCEFGLLIWSTAKTWFLMIERAVHQRGEKSGKTLPHENYYCGMNSFHFLASLFLLFCKKVNIQKITKNPRPPIIENWWPCQKLIPRKKIMDAINELKVVRRIWLILIFQAKSVGARPRISPRS
jgi:hypothetical protein